MTIHQTQRGDTEVFALEGRLDTTTSHQLHEALLVAIDGTRRILLDFSELAYVSSAGLRVLLAAQKQCIAKGADMALCGVRPEVLEVLEMTGFTDLLTIQ